MKKRARGSRCPAHTLGFTEYTNDTKIPCLVCKTQTPSLLTVFFANVGLLRPLPADTHPDMRTLTHPSISHSMV